jgi:hypothetical protein
MSVFAPADNIAEFILYMWQTEDLLRAFNFKLDDVSKNYVEPSGIEEVTLRRELNWYQIIASEMLEEGMQENGHISRVKQSMIALEQIHVLLKDDIKDATYIQLIEKATPYLAEFIKTKSKKALPLTEACLNALYGTLVLKLKKAKISPETAEAIDSFKNVLAYLSARYKQMKEN